jgi:hypothetical protein
MTRLLVTGARDWTDARLVHHELNRAITRLCPMYPDGVDWDTRGLVLVHGACPTGADFIANEWAIVNFIDVDPHPADWNRWGKAAGPRRNSEMVALGADLCLAFIGPKSRGTVDCADKAAAAGIETLRWYA